MAINFPDPSESPFDDTNIPSQRWIHNGDAWVRESMIIIPEAPIDGKPYNRQDGAWTEDTSPSGDAPIDGLIYGRKDALWTPAVGEAPNDGVSYIRTYDDSSVNEADHRMVWQQVYTGYKNVIINGRKLVNQRGFANWGSTATNDFGPDRWYKHSGTQMAQRIEKNNVIPNHEYTLSWQDSAGSSGEVWGDSSLGAGTSPLTVMTDTLALKNYVKVILPNTATNVQFERGPNATEFDVKPISAEELDCLRFYSETAEGLLQYGYAYVFNTSSGIANNTRQIYSPFSTLMYRKPDALVPGLAGDPGVTLGVINLTIDTISMTRGGIRIVGQAVDIGKGAGVTSIKLNAEIPE